MSRALGLGYQYKVFMIVATSFFYIIILNILYFRPYCKSQKMTLLLETMAHVLYYLISQESSLSVALRQHLVLLHYTPKNLNICEHVHCLGKNPKNSRQLAIMWGQRRAGNYKNVETLNFNDSFRRILPFPLQHT